MAGEALVGTQARENDSGDSPRERPDNNTNTNSGKDKKEKNKEKIVGRVRWGEETVVERKRSKEIRGEKGKQKWRE